MSAWGDAAVVASLLPLRHLSLLLSLVIRASPLPDGAERWRYASQPTTYVVSGRRIRVLERTALQAARVLITPN